MRSGQLSVEFMFIIVFICSVTTIFIILIGNKIADLERDKEYLLLKEAAAMAQAEVDTAAITCPGYARDFILPERIGNAEYNITREANSFVFSTANFVVLFKIYNVSGMLLPGNNSIKNIGGGVHIN